MRFYLISDNHDTLTGMRLAGIEGTIVQTDEELEAALEAAILDPQIGILLVTEGLAARCPQKINQVKLTHQRPLLTEIPDRHGVRDKDAILRYVREAIGVKI